MESVLALRSVFLHKFLGGSNVTTPRDYSIASGSDAVFRGRKCCRELLCRLRWNRLVADAKSVFGDLQRLAHKAASQSS
jgi:hypothetical protein